MPRKVKTMKKRSSVTRRNRRSRQKRTSSKNKRGGGYGGNPYCNDPNFSIFNTNLLKLFPYSTFGKG
jgi:hypothetical protein